MPPDLSSTNERELQRLLVSVLANPNRLDLFVAICDDRNLQAKVINAYETALRAKGVTPYQTRLTLKRASLKATLTALVAQEPSLRSQTKAVVTVLGGADLLRVKLTEAKSEQEKFFFSLQWTRESLRAFHFPVVVWLSDAVATGVAQQAQDFWSWRSGVFEFETTVSPVPLPKFRPDPPPLEQPPAPDALTAPDLTELIQQITEIQQQTPQSPLLITLYIDLGDACRKAAYAPDSALQAYEQAINLAETLKDKPGLARALHQTGGALCDSGQHEQAIAFYQQALEMCRDMGNRRDEASTLGNLGVTYDSLGQYPRAIEFYQQALAIAIEIGDRSDEASILDSLGNTHHALGQYPRAIEFSQQALAIATEIGHRLVEASALINLGTTYDSLEQYPRAIEFNQQALVIATEIGHRLLEAKALNNLGTAYKFLGQYPRAIEFCQKSLAIATEIGDWWSEVLALIGLGSSCHALGQYPRAIEFYQQALAIALDYDRFTAAMTLKGLGSAYHSLGQYPRAIESYRQAGDVYSSLGQYQRAIESYQQALAIETEIGDRHGAGLSLSNLGYALAELDRPYESAQSYQHALDLYKELKLDHMIEGCEQAIAEQKFIIATQRRVAPPILHEPILYEQPLSVKRPQSPTKQLQRQRNLWFWLLAVITIAAICLWYFL
ncbi:MAG: tetratricopeptide repeat protein [Kaiparowitsia implicata GSE-PSE-MK54-09C]|jgi:tetratricopeptide (TPR) repeat protein|nr:tetratricopeptide repeat protein [Kaiparowitsia implicata GSE-PSE-MK54-09C]